MSQVKGGYYAAAPEAVAAVLERLRPPVDGECLILDPCAGEGKALLQLAEGLNAVPYGIELSEDRAAIVRESLPEGQALAPADFLRCAISYRSFSFIWCNPPYDYATGEEGRVESQFLERAATCWPTMACWPWSARRTWPAVTRRSISSRNDSARFRRCRFLKQVRKYNETIILGCKRKQPNAVDCTRYHVGLAGDSGCRAHIVYRLPPGAATPAVPQVGADRCGTGEVGGPESAAIPSSSGRQTS